MDIQYKRDLNQNYLILREEHTVSVQDYQIRMFTANNIKGLLKCSQRIIDGKASYYYEITSKQPMNRVFEKTLIGKEELNMIIMQIREILEQVKEYLLLPECLIFDQEHIYMDIEKRELYFCYLPGYENDVLLSFHKLAEFMLSRIDHSDKEGVALGYELYQQTLEDNYGLDDIIEKVFGEREKEQEEYKETEGEKSIDIIEGKEEIGEKEEKKEGQEKKGRPGHKGVIMVISGMSAVGIGAAVYLNRQLIGKDNVIKLGGALFLVLPFLIYYYYKKNKDDQTEEQDNIMIKGEEMDNDFYEKSAPQEMKGFLESYHDEEERYGNTMLLGYQEKSRYRFLEYINFQEEKEIIISEYPFLLGKIESVVDQVIKNDTVSRIHAKILNKGEKYYISDLNSTNGTYVNEICLEANEMAEIKEGDMIRLGEVEFYFK